jgi:DNA-binding SARP family transcriptional activator/tetratricopeptide (TPR) repeat protein
MTRILLLGGARLLSDRAGESGSTVASPRRMALLALLAASVRTGLSRDRVLALLWPESEEARARHSLDQLLYSLRSELGREAIPSGAPLRLDRSRVACDLWIFEDAISSEDWLQAVAAYGGRFLDGFHAGAGAEFESWVDSRRASVDAQWQQALERAASISSENGDSAAAVKHWMRLAAADPLSSRLALGLMRALVEAGDSVAAVRHARVHSTLVSAELGTGPDPAVDAYAASLQRASAAHPGKAGVFPSPIDSGDVESERSSGGGADVAVTPERSAGDGGAVPARAPVRDDEPALNTGKDRREPGLLTGARGLATVGVVSLVIWAALASSRVADRPSATGGPRESSIAVLPFVIQGDSRPQFGEMLASLLAARLDGAGELTTVDPNAVFRSAANREHVAKDGGALLAASLAAGSYVVGEAVLAGERLQLRISLYRTSDRRETARAAASGQADSVFALVDGLALRLLGSLANRDRAYAADAQPITTSLAAMKRYVEGEALSRAGRGDAALDAFAEAVELDSTFALGFYRLAVAQEWSGRGDRGRAALARAQMLSERLPARVRLLVSAASARDRGDVDAAERLYRSISQSYPEERDAWIGLGETLFHGNPSRGRPSAEARASLERALAMDPIRGAEPLFHLVAIAFGEGRMAAADSLSARFLEGFPEADYAFFIRAQRGFAARDPKLLAALLDELRRDQPRRYLAAIDIAAGATGEFEIGIRAAGAIAQSANRAGAAAAWMQIAWMEAARGRMQAMEAALGEAAAVDPTVGVLGRARMHAPSFLPVHRDSMRAAARALRSIRAETPGSRLEREYLGVIVSSRAGLDAEAEAHLRSLEALTRSAELPKSTWRLWSARAHRLAGAGRHTDALAALDSAGPAHEEPLDRLLRADLLFHLGRHRPAFDWYGAAIEGYMLQPMVPYSHLRRGQIMEALGQRAAALRHYRETLRMWESADVQFDTMRAIATAAVTRLSAPGRSPVRIPE